MRTGQWIASTQRKATSSGTCAGHRRQPRQKTGVSRSGTNYRLASRSQQQDSPNISASNTGTLYKAIQRGKTIAELEDKYGSRTDGEHAWDFPASLQSELEKAFREERKAGQSRLAWYCHRLTRSIDELEKSKAPDSGIERVRVALEVAQGELAAIRLTKSEAKHQLAFAIMNALSAEANTPHRRVKQMATTMTAAQEGQV